MFVAWVLSQQLANTARVYPVSPQMLAPVVLWGVITVVTVYYLTQSARNLQARLNKVYNLPPDWMPKAEFGPARYTAVWRYTPKGMRVQTNGFDLPDVPEYHPVYRTMVIRVDLETIDQIWRQVRDALASGGGSLGYHMLSDVERDRIRFLPDDLPRVTIVPSAWFDPSLPTYLKGSVEHATHVKVAVFYQSVTDGTRSNWPTLLRWEFSNVALYAIGRGDLTR